MTMRALVGGRMMSMLADGVEDDCAGGFEVFASSWQGYPKT